MEKVLWWSVIWVNADSLLLPVTCMTSARPACPSECGILQSRQSVWPAVTLYILTASLLKLKMFSLPVFERARVCVFTACTDAAMADGVSVGVGGPVSSVLLSVGLWVAELQAVTCSIVTSELVCCPTWPAQRGQITNVLARAECYPSCFAYWGFCLIPVAPDL